MTLLTRGMPEARQLSGLPWCSYAPWQTLQVFTEYQSCAQRGVHLVQADMVGLQAVQTLIKGFHSLLPVPQVFEGNLVVVASDVAKVMGIAIAE